MANIIVPSCPMGILVPFLLTHPIPVQMVPSARRRRGRRASKHGLGMGKVLEKSWKNGWFHDWFQCVSVKIEEICCRIRSGPGETANVQQMWVNWDHHLIFDWTSSSWQLRVWQVPKGTPQDQQLWLLRRLLSTAAAVDPRIRGFAKTKRSGLVPGCLGKI